MAISSSAAGLSCSMKLSAPSHFSMPSRFLPLWSCSLTKTAGGENSFSGFLRPDASFTSPNLPQQYLFALGRLGSSKGRSCVSELPTSDQSQLPAVQVEEGGGSGGFGKLSNEGVTTREEGYKVLLVYARRHTEKQVMAVLPEVVPSITPEEARRLFHKSVEEFTALVTVAVKEHAELYVEMMVERGLRAAMEPESTPE